MYKMLTVFQLIMGTCYKVLMNSLTKRCCFGWFINCKDRQRSRRSGGSGRSFYGCSPFTHSKRSVIPAQRRSRNSVWAWCVLSNLRRERERETGKYIQGLRTNSEAHSHCDTQTESRSSTQASVLLLGRSLLVCGGKLMTTLLRWNWKGQ